MEQVTEPGIDLFADNLPSMEEIKKLSDTVRSSEKNVISFNEQLESNMSRTGQKASLALGIGLFILDRTVEAAEKLEKAPTAKRNSSTWLMRFAGSANTKRRLKICRKASISRQINSM